MTERHTCPACDRDWTTLSDPPTVDEAILIVEHSRAVHEEWARYFAKYPTDQAQAAVGTEQFHRNCMARYDRVLTVLREVQHAASAR